MKHELKACPFCGLDEARLVSFGTIAWVACGNCDAEAANTDTEDDAVAAWNRRAGDDRSEMAPVGGDFTGH